MWRVVTSDDVDRATLAEVPALQLAALLGATENLDVAEPDVAAVRARVPGEHRALFDELLAEARYGHRQRDDIRGLCWNWPCGLVRRALLEAGRRLHAAGGVHEVAHVVELFPDELDRLLLGRVRQGADEPSADELAQRAAERDCIEGTPPPRLLGEPEPAPPLDVFPKALARVTAAIMANLRADVTPPPPADDDSSTVNGIGIGDTTYSGRACVVHDLMLAFDQLQPGDVLVAPFTGPSVNSLLPVIGALVVEEGGALCHSAIVAREFGLASVIGAHRATSRIPHGGQVEVDPAHGTVRLLGLEGVAAAPAARQTGGEHHPVVRERRGWCAVFGDGGPERVDHDRAGDASVGGDRQGVAGVVVQPRQDLDIDAGAQPVVGEVGLPHLVGLLSGEPDIRRPGAFLRGWRDQALTAQRSIDRRSRHPQLMVMLEVPGDGVGAGIEALGGQLATELDDQLDRGAGDGRR
jgi:phosphohistidine swiveling domain-containing protein